VLLASVGDSLVRDSDAREGGELDGDEDLTTMGTDADINETNGHG
jgi:hypothetical protein